MQWLLWRRGWPADQPADGCGYRVGLLSSKSGPGAIFAVACENLAAMAMDELSADGGLHGRRVPLLVADDAKDPGRRRVRGPPADPGQMPGSAGHCDVGDLRCRPPRG